MCAVAAAQPGAYSGTQPRFPADTLELDFRGRLDASPDYAYIDIGEVKTSPDYSTAVPQLGRNLKVLRWMVRTTFPKADVRCVGRLFLPRGAVADAAQQDVALREWNYTLYVHVV